MDNKWMTRLIQAAAITVSIVAVCQELEKPKEERTWHGKVAGLIPYDFRLPSPRKFKEAYWNPYDSRLFTPRVFGVGWAVNFYALLENLGLIGRADVSEEHFLMPTKSIKEIMTNLPEIEAE